MDNWSFTGKPDIPAWPRDERGQEEKAVLLMQTFDSPADTDMVISLLAAYGIPCFKYYDLDGGAGKVINGRWRTRKRNNTPERSLSLCWITRRKTSAGWPATP